VKVLVSEKDRDVALGLLNRATWVATSRIAYVECRAALSRAKREGRLDARGERLAAQLLDQSWRGIVVVEVDEVLTRRAADLTRRHPLRAADAIHLASAELMAENEPGEIVFACWDRSLWESAAALGFAVAPA
jgi:predicted nucleic acid-binding protein